MSEQGVNRNARKIVVILFLLIIPVTFFTLRFFRRNRRESTQSLLLQKEAELRKEQVYRVKTWLSQPKVPILSAEIDKKIREIVSREGCVQVPPGGTPVPIQELRESEYEDLKKAIKGLVQAYAKNDPDVILAYMEERDERFPAEDGWRRTLIESHGRKKTEVEAASDKDIFGIYWRDILKCGMHWHALVDDAGCITIWRCKNPLDKQVRATLGNEDNTVFRNVVRANHQFKPKSQSLEAVLSQDGSALMADVKLVIQYDKDRYNEPRPYYLRFWFEPSHQHWHPLEFVLIPTVDQTYPPFLF